MHGYIYSEFRVVANSENMVFCSEIKMVYQYTQLCAKSKFETWLRIGLYVFKYLSSIQ